MESGEMDEWWSLIADFIKTASRPPISIFNQQSHIINHQSPRSHGSKSAARFQNGVFRGGNIVLTCRLRMV
jgi:hypothetical protein